MKQPIALLMAAEYDPDEKESIQKAFSVTENELLSLMLRIGREAKNPSREWLGAYVQDQLMEMIKGHELSDNMILYLACYGASKLWEGFADGILLVLDAEDEKKQ